jgi:hypothetical protein
LGFSIGNLPDGVERVLLCGLKALDSYLKECWIRTVTGVAVLFGPTVIKSTTPPYFARPDDLAR